MAAQTLSIPNLVKRVKEKLISGDEVLDLGINQPFELVKGRIVYMDHMGDEHGIIESELSRQLGNFNLTRKLGWVLSGEVGVYTQFNPDTVRGVDVIFVSRQRLPAPSGKALKIAPELVVEIISPTDRWRDVREKIEEYFAIGVEQVWVVEPEHKSVLIFRSPTDLIKLAQQDTLQGEGVLAGFTLSLEELFADL